jgi:hypothetical protein
MFAIAAVSVSGVDDCLDVKHCRIAGRLTLDDLEATEIGDWKMP